jgi:4'-phosphopantetheinyl transferase
VNVWGIRVDGGAIRHAVAESAWLDAAERDRASSLQRADDRALYVVAHVALRRLLGAYLGIPAAAVTVRRGACPVCGGPHGRPEVTASTELHFSLSHTPGLVVVAVAADPVGADVESLSREPEALFDLLTVLHRDEREAIKRLPENRQSRAFLSCWVRKEAYLKGRGIGLSEPLDSSYVGLGERYSDAVEPTVQLGEWGLADVAISDEHAVAVALLLSTERRDMRVTMRWLELPGGRAQLRDSS